MATSAGRGVDVQDLTGDGALPADSYSLKPSEDDIRRLAFHYWEERQKAHIRGSDLGDWLLAEEEIRRQRRVEEASEESFPASDSPAW